MSDEQIEAVFAHELGHVVHKHLTWYGLFVVVLLLAELGPGQSLDHYTSAHLPGWVADIALPVLAPIGGLLLLFGGLSRYFERQADVYAARMIEQHHRPADSPADPPPDPPADVPAHPLPVGTYGANLFASALHRVAIINGIPIHSRNLSHGSIAGRIDYLHQLSADPLRTIRFDRFMTWIYLLLISLLVCCGCWAAIVLMHG